MLAAVQKKTLPFMPRGEFIKIVSIRLRERKTSREYSARRVRAFNSCYKEITSGQFIFRALLDVIFQKCRIFFKYSIDT